MKTWVVKVFGRKVLEIESREESAVNDVVRGMVATAVGIIRERDRYHGEDGDDCEDYDEITGGLIPCESCGEMFLPDDDEAVNAEFANLTEKLMWGPPPEEEPEEE